MLFSSGIYYMLQLYLHHHVISNVEFLTNFNCLIIFRHTLIDIIGNAIFASFYLIYFQCIKLQIDQLQLA